MGSFWCRADHLEWEVLGIWLLYSSWPTKISILNIRHKHFLTKLNYDICIAIETYSICNWMKSSTDDPYAISDPKSQFIWLVCCNQCLANKTDHLEWEVFDAGLTILNGKSLGLDYSIMVRVLKYRFWISDRHFLTKPNYDISAAIENDNIWNWLKSCSEYYTISDSRSNCIWPEYCGQCLADKTDHLEWEVFDEGLTILNGKSLGLDYYILVGLLKYRFWISDTSIFWLSLIMIYA